MVVNLVDNAAEAMRDSLVKRLYVATQRPTPDIVELIVADTGCGISPEDKEKLFLPYFSTKSRGTGLGLAIVNHIVSEHGGADPRGEQPARRRAFHRRDSGARSQPMTEAQAVESAGMRTSAHPGRRRRAGHPRIAVAACSRTRATTCDAVGDGESCLAELAARALRRGAARCLAAGHRRHGDAGAHSGDPVRRPARWWS